jgi:hypothetical protein
VAERETSALRMVCVTAKGFEWMGDGRKGGQETVFDCRKMWNDGEGTSWLKNFF